MEDKLYLYVLEYSIPDVFYIEITEEYKHKRVEDILHEHGYHASTCTWMFMNKLITEIREDKC